MDLLNAIFVKIYKLFFGSPPSEFTRELFRNFLLAAGSTGIATVLTFGVNILAARFMGPAEFGKWNLIGSWAEFMVIVPLFGMTTAMPRYLGSVQIEEKSELVGTGFRITFFMSIAAFLVYLPIQKYFHIIKDQSIVHLAFLYAIILAFFYLFQSFFQGMKQFKRLAGFWLASAFGFVAIVLLYVYQFRNHTFLSLYWGNLFRLGFMVICGLVIFGPQLFRYSKKYAKELLHFGSFSMLSIFAGFFSLGSIDNIMINRYLGPAAVGVYAAYYVAFSVFISKILNSFLQVFLPMASGHQNLRQLLNKILSLVAKLFLLLLAGLIILIRVLFIFYGKNYNFNWLIAGALALNITIYTCMMLVGYIMSAKGIKGARFGFMTALVSAVINVILDIILIPRLGIFGSVLSSLAATLSVVILQYQIMKGKFLDEV